MVVRQAQDRPDPAAAVLLFCVGCGSGFVVARALRLAQETFDIEGVAVLGLKARTNESFARAVELMLRVRGRVVVMGIGKSGHIGRKMAATLASTGTPAMFVH